MENKLIFLLFIVNLVCGRDRPVVNTTQGLVRGLVAEDGGYSMFLGIPFGAVDPKNPFGPSSPAPAFNGTFDAIDDSAICPQEFRGELLGSLDCLHLSVFVPPSANTNLLPVLLFIYGGAFENGFYGRFQYGPKFLVKHDVILVTFNYRVGPYGFMCTDNRRVPGNQGTKDQLLAMRWVHENIERFGGDPNRVTLSGHSAGGMTADLQIIRNNDGPKLFQQVILQSGSAFFPSFPATQRNSPLILAEHFGFQTSDIDEALDFLANIEPLQMIVARQQLGIQFRPCIERIFEGVEPFLTENWVAKEVIPTAKDLNMMIGYTDKEALGLLLVPTSDLSNVVNDSLRESFAIEHEDFVGLSDVRHFFFGDDELDENKFKDAIHLRSDTSFVYTSMRSLKRHLNSGISKAYLYVFSYDGERNNQKRNVNTTLEGAAHGDEIGYLYDISYFGAPSVKDQLVIDRMTHMWVNFVKYGDPTPQLTSLLPVKWEPITPTSTYHYMHIDSQLQVGTRPFNERMTFWDLFHEVNGHLHRFLLDN